MSRHRADTPPRARLRYGRIAVLAVSLTTTAVGLLGGVGVLPTGGSTPVSDARAASSDVLVTPSSQPSASSSASSSGSPSPRAAPPEVAADGALAGPAAPTEQDADRRADRAAERALPASSGEGRRVVFSQSRQRVWLVDDEGGADAVARTYLVSGSLTDNLQPGTYEVWSRSEDAVGIDDSGTMKWFVRFTRGPSGAAIGFHTIPVDDGERVQTRAELGTPQSHGCIRQKTPDALALWRFAPLGTTVVVVA